jgi:hypothetical protein
VHNDPPVFPGRLDPSDRFRERRRRARRRRRIRGLIVLAALIGLVVALALNARFISGDEEGPAASTSDPVSPAEPTGSPDAARSAVPDEIRGVHVTAALASIPGKLDEYIGLAGCGVNTIELDLKDENGEVGFVRPAVPLAADIGAAQSYYDPRAVAKQAKTAGIYLIGRLVVFEDPKLAASRPDLAVKTPGGDIWTTREGLAWTNPYDERVWDYNVDIAEAAARAGFDEIMFDYVRFPTDGTVPAVYSKQNGQAKWEVIARFVEYAAKRLKPLGVELSAAVFGLSATRDLGIGQRPRLLAKHLDALYPMVYPSHYVSGEYGISDPSADPARTVSFSLLDFRKKLEGRDARIVPWLQDFFGYTLEDVEDQISAVQRAGNIDPHVSGFMLWNSDGVYTNAALGC